MIKRMFIMFVVFLSFTAMARVDSMSYGDNTISWRTYETEGPVAAFTISGSTVWYSTGNSVGTYDFRSTKSVKKRQYPKLGDVSSEGIKTIECDNKGGIWFGGPQGAVHYKNDKFISFTKEKGLSDDGVNKILSASNAVWVGTDNGLSCYKNGSWKVYTTKGGLTGNNIRDITVDDKGTVWFATDKGITEFDGTQWKKHTMKNGLSWNDAKAIAYDERKGELWAAVGEQDVNSYNGKEWNTYMDIQIGIVCIMIDTQSRIWFGSMSGPIKYNGIEWLTEASKVGFPAAQVSDMYRDENGDLFFGIETGVLHMKNPYPY